MARVAGRLVVVVAVVALFSLGSGAGSPAHATEPVAAEQVPAEQPAEPVAAPEEGAEAGDGEMSEEDRAAYAAALRDAASQVRGEVVDKIIAKLQRKQADRMDTIALVLTLVALSGVLIMLMPFYLRRRYPYQTGRLFKYSAISSGLFIAAVALFALVLFTMRGAQTVLGEFTNPQVVMLESTFDLVEDKAEEMAEVGPLLIEPTLASLSGETDQPVLTIMLENVQKLNNDISVFRTVGRFFQQLDFVFGMLPLLFVGLALVLFAKIAYPTLVEIVRLPERAVQGDPGVVRHTVRLTLRNVWAEAKATFATVGVLMLLTVGAALLLGQVLQPAIEVFMAYLTVAFLYVQLEPTASSFWILFSLMGSILFLVLNLAVIILSTAFYLAKSQKIFQARFRSGVPLRFHGHFWRWGTASAVWAQVLPVLYILVAVEAIGWFAEKSVDRFLVQPGVENANWPFILSTGPALFIVTFGLIFWLAWGVRSLRFLAGYRVEGPPAPPAHLGPEALMASTAGPRM